MSPQDTWPRAAAQEWVLVSDAEEEMMIWVTVWRSVAMKVEVKKPELPEASVLYVVVLLMMKVVM
jgi:hypothetical protein